MIDEDLDLNFVKCHDDYDQTTHIKIRLNCSKDWGAVDWKKFRLKDEDRECAHFDCVIVYYHGGGFITGSSNVYQEYTRRWANDSKFPVFSIDYRLAPEFAFPDGLTDCWQAYLWLIKYSKKYLRITFDKIIIMGDSAGGNLIL
jgi:acetyl esterase/lipase